MFDGQALTLRYYRDAGLADWVDRTVREHDIRTAVVFSSSMAQYVEHRPDLRMLVDFVDVDSAKWSDYAQAHRRPTVVDLSPRRYAFAELRAPGRCAGMMPRFFVTESETRLFRSLAPDVRRSGRGHVQWRRCRFLCTGPDAGIAVRSWREAAGVHRGHGLLAQYRCSHLVREGRFAAASEVLADAALSHRLVAARLPLCCTCAAMG